MILRRSASLLLPILALPVVLTLAGCSSLQSLTIQPASGSVVLTGIGQTAQFTAVGTSQMGNAQPTTGSVSANWSVSNAGVATINSATGLATAVGPGYTQVIAQSNGVTATSDITVNVVSTTPIGPGTASISSITIIPSAQTVASTNDTGAYIAIGTTSSGATVDLTSLVGWGSSSASIASIGLNTGLAAAGGQSGTATITALYTNPGGSVIAGTASFTVLAGTTDKYTAVTVIPGSQALSSGQTGQFIALATSGSTGLLTDVTLSPQLKWYSSAPSVAKIGLTTGLATGQNAGTTTITAELTNTTDNTVVSANATIAGSSTPAPEPLVSLSIIPGSITVGNLQDTGQFLAIGTYSTPPYVRDLTNSPTLTWISAFPNSFPVDTNTGGNSGASAGLVTAYGNGSATIIAEATNPSDNTIQTATATFNCPLALPDPNGIPPTPGSCYPGTQTFSLLATLTIYNEGLNNGGPGMIPWEITGPSATGTPDVIHCGPVASGQTGGSVCTATYPFGTTVVLEATGGAFGGWSYNCAPSDSTGNTTNPPPVTSGGPNYCAITFSPAVYVNGTLVTPANSNVTVGAIFN
jgi:hypothetical protein